MKTQILPKPILLALAMLTGACAAQRSDARDDGSASQTSAPPMAPTPAAQATTAESGNPNSVLSKNPPAPAAATAAPEMGSNRAEAQNPNSILNKDRPAAAPPAQPGYDAQLRAAEAPNPNSVDSALPSNGAVLQRLHAFNQGAIAAGQAAEQNSGTTAAYGHRLAAESKQSEQLVARLARRFHAALDAPGDERARAVMVADQEDNERLQGLTGPAFDRTFASQIARSQQRELDAVHALLGRCVETRICSVLKRMEPKLTQSVSQALSLSAAIAESDRQE